MNIVKIFLDSGVDKEVKDMMDMILFLSVVVYGVKDIVELLFN